MRCLILNPRCVTFEPLESASPCTPLKGSTIDHPMTYNDLHRHVQNMHRGKDKRRQMCLPLFLSLSLSVIGPSKHWPSAQLDGIKGTTTRLTIIPDCIVFQPSLDETSLDEFTIYQTINETRISATHRHSLTRSLYYRLLLLRRPSGCCCTEEPHRHTPQRTRGRIDMLPRSAVWNAVLGHFGSAPSTSTSRSHQSSQHRHSSRLHWNPFISLTGLFSCFLSCWKFCAPRRPSDM